MVESHVRLVEESVYPLPGQFFPALCMVAQSLDSRIGRIADVFMTRHAEIDARYAGPRSAGYSRVAFLTLNSDLVHTVNFVRKFNGLLRLTLDAEKMTRSFGVGRVGGCELR